MIPPHVPRFAALALAAAFLGGPASTSSPRRTATVPPHAGERLTYAVEFGPIHVGRGEMRLVGMETLQTHPVWHAQLRVWGGIPFYHVNDTTSSWFDVGTYNSRHFIQQVHDGPYHADRDFVIDPERQVFTRNGQSEQKSVADPLDDVSFIYFVRSLHLEPGQAFEFNRYFQPEGNPVRIRVLRRDTVTVPAGRFPAIVVEPTIVTSGLFSQNGRAQLWFSDDSAALLLKMESHIKIGSLNLYLTGMEY